MAAAAPSPYRSSPPSSDLSNAGASSSSPAPAVSSKKQQDVAAGRRRWEEFKKKKAQKSSAGPPSDESTSSEQQSGAGSTSGKPSTSAASNGHVSKDGRQDGINTSSSNGPTIAEGAVVTDSKRQHSGNIPLSNAETRLREAEEDFDSKVFSSGLSSSNVDRIRGASVHATDQPNISSSGPLFGRPETIGGFKASVPTTFANTDISNKNGFGTTAAPLVADGPIVVPAATTSTSPVPSYIGAPIAGHVGQGKGVRPAFTPSFPASQPLPGNTSQRQGGGSLVHTNDRLFSNRGPREEAHPPSSMEPEQELVSSAVSVGFPPYVPPSELMRPDRHSDGTTSNAGTSAFLPSNKQSWRMPEGEIGKGSVSSGVNSLYSTVPPPSGTSESFAPVGSSPIYLPFPPPRSHHPWLSSFSPSSISEPSLPASMSNGSDFSSSMNTSAQTSSFSAGAAVSVLHRSAESSDSVFSGTKASAFTLYENGVVEPTTRPFSRSSVSVLEPPTQIKKSTEPVDPPWQLPPTKSARDDFAMLEQHIEDLTQEKFSLQRGLDAARALAETLAQENSALTEDYNKQGALVNELKEETQRLNGEIRAQAVVVKNMRSEKDRAVQESKAAVGRAQALAAEVIALEEKVLKSRSQELKLQREAESLAADNESQKRQIASLEKDRANLRSLVEALQEEKTLLQTRLRKAVSVEDVRLAASEGAPSARSNNRKMDVSTSTEDLELEAFLTAGTAVLPSSSQLSLEQAQIVGFPSLDQQHGQPAIMPSLQSAPTLPPTHSSQSSESSSSLITRDSPLRPSTTSVGTRLGGRSLHLGPGSSIISQDHVVIVENINTLISELAEEKEALLKALRAESVGASELRALNAELSHKLEAQTQRLELAVAQSMAHGSTPTLENAFETSRLGPVYVDEGDEVVDRVLGWIMQLFPSGSSRRKRL